MELSTSLGKMIFNSVVMETYRVKNWQVCFVFLSTFKWRLALNVYSTKYNLGTLVHFCCLEQLNQHQYSGRTHSFPLFCWSSLLPLFLNRIPIYEVQAQAGHYWLPSFKMPSCLILPKSLEMRITGFILWVGLERWWF